MSEASLPFDAKAEAQTRRKATLNTISRILRYTVVRLVDRFRKRSR
jgi:hypothetical protein